MIKMNSSKRNKKGKNKTKGIGSVFKKDKKNLKTNRKNSETVRIPNKTIARKTINKENKTNRNKKNKKNKMN
jgi:hypothetical protein